MKQSTATPPKRGHTEVSPNWHLYYDGFALFSGYSENEVIAKARRHIRNKRQAVLTEKFQQEARAYGSNRSSLLC